MSLSFAYNGLISGHLHLFGTGSDYFVLRFICERTLRFDKLTERISARQFETGIPGITLGLPFSRQEIHKAKSRLRGRGLIFFRGRVDGRNDITINLPAIWYAIKKVYRDISCFPRQIVEILERVTHEFGELVKPKFDKRGKEILTKMTEGVREGLRDSKRGREGKRSKGLRVQNLTSYFRDLCSEYDVEYSGEAWTKKLTGQARMFIEQDCSEMNRDPKDVFRDLISSWHILRRSLFDDFKRPLAVPSRFTFSFVYSHRKRILTALSDAKRRSELLRNRYQIIDERDSSERRSTTQTRRVYVDTRKRDGDLS